jgi:hypothetical protein
LPKVRYFSQAGFKSQAEHEDEAAARSNVEFIESSKLFGTSSVEDL